MVVIWAWKSDRTEHKAVILQFHTEWTNKVLYIPALGPDPWRIHRVFSAYPGFTIRIDPGLDARAVYVSYDGVGWILPLTSEGARQRLECFYAGLTGTVAAERPYGDPCIQGQYDAAAAL